MNIDGCSPTIRACSGIARIAATSLLMLGGACRPPHTPPAARSVSTAPRGNSTGCDFVITAPIARNVFDLLKGIHAPDRCVLEDLTTQQTAMRITWARDHAVLPGTVVVLPKSCAPRGVLSAGRYAIEGSADFQRECPATYAAMTHTFQNQAPSPVLGEQPRNHLHPHRGVYGILALMALGAVAWLIRWARTSPR